MTKSPHLTPLPAIRAKCIRCCNGQKAEVRLCPAQSCPLFDFRMGHRPQGERNTEKALSPRQAIREKCRDCTGGVLAEIRECPIPDCSLYSLRPYQQKRRVEDVEEDVLHDFQGENRHFSRRWTSRRGNSEPCRLSPEKPRESSRTTTYRGGQTAWSL